MKILITGTAGFIGYHLVLKLSKYDCQIIGVDNINNYYDVRLKYARLSETGIAETNISYGCEVQSTKYNNYRFLKIDITDRESLAQLFDKNHFDLVINLAAQAGVRYSLENPYAYIDSNIVGFLNLLECVRNHSIQNFIYASSSSVYGENTKVPFSEKDQVDLPVSLYAATKRANELIAHTYSKLYGISTIGLRFFTVYGPWGRPDMAPVLFAKAICYEEPIEVFNYGDLSRDFTYVDDIVDGIVRVIDNIQKKPNGADIYNIGCGQPVKLMDFIQILEKEIGKSAKLIMLPMQKGDVHTTYASTIKLEQNVGYKPHVSLKEGIRRFITWYKSQNVI